MASTAAVRDRKPKRMTARELARLTPEERAPILREAAERLRMDYESDPDLTAFTVLDGEEFHDYAD